MQEPIDHMQEKEWVGVGYLRKGKLLISHRYNLLPLLPSGPGGIHRELVVQDLPLSTKLRLFLKEASYFTSSIFDYI